MRAARAQGMRASSNSGMPRSNPHRWDQPYNGQSWYPWYYYWDPNSEHQQLEAARISDAIELEYHAACAGIPETAQARSPLDMYAVESTRLRDGVIVRLDVDAGPPEVLLVSMRCHRAWLRLAPREAASQDMIAVAGVKVVVHAGRDGIEVMFSNGEAAVAELDRRARVAVMRAQRLRAIQAPP